MEEQSEESTTVKKEKFGVAELCIDIGNGQAVVTKDNEIEFQDCTPTIDNLEYIIKEAKEYVKYRNERNKKNDKENMFATQLIIHIDGTPDEYYPLRILKAYRQNCECKFSNSSGNVTEDSVLINKLNEMQDERAKILDNAMKILEDEGRRQVLQ